MQPDELIFPKLPNEIFPIEANFSQVLTTGEAVTLASCTVSAVDSVGDDAAAVLDQTTKGLSSSSKGLVIKVKGGTVPLGPYIITFILKTDQGNKWGMDVKMVMH